MVVKDRVGRRRYIIAEDSPKVPEALREIRKIDDWGKLILRDRGFALIRCKHWNKKKVLDILHSHGIKTYRTTGTIRKAKRIMRGLSP